MNVNSISTSTLSTTLQGAVGKIQTELTKVATENSTGQIADIGLTYGQQTGQNIALHNQMADLTALTSANAVAASQLDGAANALTSLQGLAQTMNTTLVQNATTASSSVAATALQQQAAGALQSYAELMNTAVGGVYVFGGLNSGAAPIAQYAQTPASAAQTSAQNAFQSFFGFSTASSQVATITATQMQSFLSGPFAALFSGASWSSDWSSASSTAISSRIDANQTVTTSVSANQSAFQDMAQGLTMISEFGGLALSGGAYAALVAAAQTAMNSSDNGLTSVGAAVGTMQNQIKQANSAIELQQNVLTAQINTREQVNAYDVASRVSQLSTQLQAAYSLTAQIQKLSLVNYL